MVIIPFTLPYKWVCSKCKLGDIYWQPSNFCNLCKVVATCTFDIHINTTIEVIMVHHAFPMSKFLGCFPCSNFKKNILWQSIPVKECLWSSSLEIWNFLVFSTWVQLGNFWIQWEILTSRSCWRGCWKSCSKFFLCLNFFGILFSSRYFVSSSLFLYVDRSLLHIVRPHL